MENFLEIFDIDVLLRSLKQDKDLMLMSQANPPLLLGLPHDHGHYLPSYFGEEPSGETHLSLITLLMNLRTRVLNRGRRLRRVYASCMKILDKEMRRNG